MESGEPMAVITEKQLAKMCNCSVQILLKWLCRTDFSHFKFIYDKGRGNSKLNRRYANVRSYDIDKLQKYVSIGFRHRGLRKCD